MNIFNYPHRRYNILTGEWILVSPHRMKRPWQGQTEDTPRETRPAYDPNCYLCPGNVRSSGIKNPDYTEPFVFVNDFSAIIEDVSPAEINMEELIIAKSEEGICKVICFSPRHDLTLPQMSMSQISAVIHTWTTEYLELGSRSNINYVQIFENKGAIMGCSNPHPHGQIWAQSSIPVEPAKETGKLSEYHRKHSSCLLCDYLNFELHERERLVIENEDFAVLVPFWAVWPYEVMILSKRHRAHLGEFTEDEKDTYADILRRLTIRYDNIFDISFPYSAGIHQAPTDGTSHPEWHFHMHFYPPLLRSATVKKFMVGYEMLANPQRDLTAEVSAAKLREVSEKLSK